MEIYIKYFQIRFKIRTFLYKLIICRLFGHEYKNVGNLENKYFLCFKCHKRLDKNGYNNYIRKKKIKTIL